jgi:hypothetical protein
LDSTLKAMGFEQSPHEAAIYRWGNGGNALLVGVYVDDLVITGTKDAEVVAFKEEMKATFQMSDLGPFSFYLGIEVHQDDSGITLRQTAYTKRVVELAGLTDCNPALTPMEERLKLSRDSTTEKVDARQYQRLVGLSFYLGIEVHQDDSGITLRHTAYTKHVVELAGLTDCNPALTPMEERLNLSRDSTTEEVDATQYRHLVGSLRYLAHTRPDLAVSVGYVSRFMQRPTTEH